MSHYDDFDDNDSFVSRLGSRFGVRHGVIAVVVLAVLGGGYALISGGDLGGMAGNVPVVRADTTPYKVAPEEVGGMPVPNQNSTIFETLKGQDAEKPRVENLLAEDEQPMTKAEIAPAEKPAEPTEAANTNTEESKDTMTTKTVPEDAPPSSQDVAMIDAKSDTTKPEPMPTAPAGSDVAATEPSATSTMTDTEKPETPVAVTTEVAKPPVKEEPKEPVKAEAKPDAEKPPVKALSSGSSAIQFAAVKSDAEARKLWSSLQSKYPELSGRTLRVQRADLGDKGTFYRVQAAGLSADSASSLCSSIKARGGSCMVVK